MGLLADQIVLVRTFSAARVAPTSAVVKHSGARCCSGPCKAGTAIAVVSFLVGHAWLAAGTGGRTGGRAAPCAVHTRCRGLLVVLTGGSLLVVSVVLAVWA